MLRTSRISIFYQFCYSKNGFLRNLKFISKHPNVLDNLNNGKKKCNVLCRTRVVSVSRTPDELV